MRRSNGSRPLLGLASAVLAGSGLLGVNVAFPTSAAAIGPLPDCRLDDILTEPRGYDDWEVTLVDWMLTLGPKYRPPDLVSVSKADVGGGGLVREVAIDDLRAMAAAARKNGTPIKVLSPFRGYQQQVELFYDYAGRDLSNFENAITFSARPGHSEHQTGLTIDFGSLGDTQLTSKWEVTPAGGWMAKNAWKYGWLMSYPKGEVDAVCYGYEPWHYRYVGRDTAAKIHDSGLTIREYLWANHTQLDPACVALPAPKLETPGTPRSCAIPAPSPTPPASAAAPSPAASPVASGANGASGPPPTVDPQGSPSPTEPGATPVGTWFGVAPTLVIGGLLIGAIVLLLAWSRWRRRRRYRRGRGIRTTTRGV